MQTPSQSLSDAHSQSNMSEAQLLNANLGLLNLPEVANLLRVSRVTLYRFIGQGRISVHKVGRRLRIQKKDVLEFLEANRYEREKG